MEFYDMISKTENDIYKNIPLNYLNLIRKFDFSKVKERGQDDFSKILNILWKKTLTICKKEINSEYMNELDAFKKELVEDSKFHSIINIYVSLINKDKECKSLNQCIKQYTYYYNDFKLKGKKKLSSKYTEDSDFKKDDEELKKAFENNIYKWISDIVYGKYNPEMNKSDFYYSLCDDFIRSYDDISEDDKFIYYDYKLLYIITKMWTECPYNEENLLGMTFKQLYKFHEKFDILLDSHDDIVDKKIYLYFVERLFNIHFINSLSVFIDKNLEERLKKLHKFKYIFIRLPRNFKFLRANIKCIKKVAQNRDKNFKKTKNKIMSNWYDNYISIKVKESIIDHKNQINENIKNEPASVLNVLSNLASLPMTFSREKYISKIYEAFKASNYCIEFENKLIINLWYFNNYLLPLLLRVFYCLISSYNKKYANNDIKINLKEYIKNEEVYIDYDLKLNKYYEFSKELRGESFQVNVTRRVYKNRFTREIFYKVDDFLKKLEDIKFDFIKENYIDCSQYNTYYENFPNNKVYEDYKKNKLRIKDYAKIKKNYL